MNEFTQYLDIFLAIVKMYKVTIFASMSALVALLGAIGFVGIAIRVDRTGISNKRRLEEIAVALLLVCLFIVSMSVAFSASRLLA